MSTKAQGASTGAPATSMSGQKTTQANILGNQENIATTMLKADHRKVEQLFKKYDQLEDEGQKREIAHQICQELIVHTMLEEEIFYPACREKAGKDEEGTAALDEAQVEHDSAKTLINELLMEEPGSPYYDAKVAVLSEYIKHHVAEEEKPTDGIFAKAEKAGIDMAQLGQKLQARKSALLAKGKSLTQRAPKPRSLHINFSDSTQEDQDMNQRRNYGGRDQDQRFRDDEERYGSRSYGSGRYTGYEDQNRGYGRRMMRDNDREEDYGQGNYGQGGGGRYSESTSHARATYEPQEGRYGSRGYDEQYGREAYEAERYRGGSRRGYQGQDYESGGSYEGSQRGSQDYQGGRYRQGGYQGGGYEESDYQSGRQGRGEYGGSYGSSGGYGGQRSSGYGSQSRGGRYGDDIQRDWEGGLGGVSRRRGWESQGSSRYQSEDDDDRHYGRGNWRNRD